MDDDEFGMIAVAYIDAGLAPDDVPWDYLEHVAAEFDMSVFEAYVADQNRFEFDLDDADGEFDWMDDYEVSDAWGEA